MKTKNLLSIIILLCFASFIVNAQKIKEEAVPAAVKSSFAKLYPGMKNVKWEKEEGNYEAEYDGKTGEGSVLFSPSGKWLEKETEIKTSELPAQAREYVTKNYAGKKIKEASKITDPKGTVTYEAELEGKDIIFDSFGKFLKEEAKDKEDKDKAKGKD